MFKKILSIALVLMLVVGVFAGCTTEKAPSEPTPEPTPEPGTEETSSEVEVGEGQTKVVIWHSVGGRNLEALQKIMDDFNASQDVYVAEGQYQGNYDEAMQKLRSTEKGAGPDVMQLYDIGTRWMIDSGYALTMQDFIDEDNYDISDYEENILSYYTLEGVLHSMPFNCSSPIIMYNKDALAKVGLEPETAFATLDEALKTAEKLQTEGGMEVGGSLTNYSWVFEQLISMQDKELLDNGNGRKDRATKVVIDENGAGLAQLKKWKEFSQSEFTDNFGKGTQESKKQFATGTVGFVFDSCSVYEDVNASAGGNFEVGFAKLPYVNAGDTGGNSVGGGSLWLMDSGDDNRAKGGWEFVKFATSPEQQAHWSMGTGYFPIRSSAVELDVYQDYVKNVNPELLVALESLRSSKPSNSGGLMGVFPQARFVIENEVEAMINDESITPEETLANIVEGINSEIEMYNRTN